MDGNISYVFLPFSYHNREQFLALAEYYEQSGSWNLQHDEIRYLFRFVAEKMDSTRRDDCRCFHYTLSPEARLNKGFADVDSWYYDSDYAEPVQWPIMMVDRKVTLYGKAVSRYIARF